MLLEAGARITKKSIRIFKSWGVNEIAIKGKRAAIQKAYQWRLKQQVRKPLKSS